MMLLYTTAVIVMALYAQCPQPTLHACIFLMRWLQLRFNFDSTAVRRSFDSLSTVI